MKKTDIFFVILAFLINLGIVFLISHKPTMNTNDTVKIGMVSLENDKNKAANLKGLKNIDSNEINKEAKEIVEKKEEDKSEEKIESEEVKEKPNEELKEEKKEVVVEKEAEKKLEKENNKQTKKEEIKEKVKPSLADLKKAISSSKPKFTNSDIKKESFNPEKESDEDLDRILGTVENGEGLVSGSKMGTIGGKILVKWNSNNRKPVFPEIAEYSGKNGIVKIKLKVDNYGNIISYEIEKGSGVPEIDIAIEKVINTWKINLLKNNKEIGGTFYINYSFNLK